MNTSPILCSVILVSLFGLSACGDSSGLSRGKAADMIQEKINKSGDFPTVTVKVGKAFFDVPKGEYRKDSVCASLMNDENTPAGYVPYRRPNGKWRNWGFAHEEGFMRSPSEIVSGMWLGSPSTSLKCTFELTDKAAPYVVGKDRDDIVTLKVVDGVDIEVTGVSKPADMFGSTISEAVYTYTYKLNPLGKALAKPFQSIGDSEKNGDVSGQGKRVFRLFDDGWRLGS